MPSDEIRQIRSFNRTVTRRLGVLNEKYLGRERPLAESRVLYEIGLAGAAVGNLRARLGLDSGFVSRLLRNLERKGLVTTVRRPGADGRARFARLTRAGAAELRRINALSDELVHSMLAPLTAEQAGRLVSAMSEVDRLLRASSIEVVPVDPRSPGARSCLDQYFDELAVRFREGYDRAADESDDVDDFIPPRGRLLMAQLFGEPVGCGALRAFAPGIGEIKRMWVLPAMRGLGVARRLLGELERLARRRRMRAVRLDTNSALTNAIRMYRAAGYREIARFNDNPYAHHWFEKTLR
jgi:DNA-binding MarR family transcriptional regulator/GNAT superfamily N-acetyltransferase